MATSDKPLTGSGLAILSNILKSLYTPLSRKINNKPLSSDISLAASDVGAVPTSRKINNKDLTKDISLTASDVGAATTAYVDAAVKNASSSGGVPIGTIVIWSGSASNIPSGWKLCNGTNGTPDLRGRFILGSSSSHAIGTKGGEETHVLTESEMPSHTHRSNGVNTPGSIGTENQTGSSSDINYYDITPVFHTGGNQAHNNMPPYYTLCYIMKVYGISEA